ncbi:MAG: GEVED domain-containing protein, partial [Cyanobacteria bacterium J06638_38]
SLAGVANDTVSDIAFASAAATMDLGIHRAHEVTSGDGSSIDLITVCYVEGVGTGSAIIIHNYNDFDDQTQNAYTQKATAQEIGTVNGLAYHRESENLFAGSFYKRHSALLGTIDFTNDNNANADTNDATGAAYTSIIYTIDNSNTNTTGNVSVFARLDDVVDPRGAIDSDAIGYSWESDQGTGQDTAGGNAVFDAVGKFGLGDLELSADGTTLWTVNLNDRKLYKVPVGDSSDPLTPATPDSSDIDSYDLITSIINNGDDLGVNPEENIRPFALSIRDGLVYFGMVNSAQYDAAGNEGTPNGVGGGDDTTSASDLRAFVYTFDPENPAAAPVQVLDIPLDYERDFASNTSLGAQEQSANWHPWVSSFPTDIITTATEQAYTQPILSDIDFDIDGNMLLGFRDRWGDQVGRGVNRPDGTGGAGFTGNAGGDLLVAILDQNTNSWTIETHVTTDNVNGNNDPDGELFGNEFFENGGANDSSELHSETGQGGLTVVPGFTEVVTTALDPIDAFAGGFEWFNTADGSFAGHFASNGDSGLDIFGNTAGTLGKSNGLGDLEFIVAASDIEIGNRIWDDTNQDGIQNAGETNFDFVGNGTGSNDTITIELYDSSGSVIDTTTTTDGEYYFSGLAPFTDYEIRLAASNFTSGAALDGYLATLQNANSDGSDRIDSDATNSGGVPSISFTTGASGTNDYSFDFGLTNATTTDYGDAPDTTSGVGEGDYQTTAANTGASHTIVSGITIGSGISADDGTLQNSDATADSDDGVTFTSTLQTTDTTFSVDVDVNVTGSTTLVAWIDFDQSGTFDSDEAVSTTVSSSGTETLTWNSFPGIIDGATYARFRLSTDGNLDISYSTGAATDGEVEDYLITVGLDYGDAPDTGSGTGTGNYQTTSADSGASHGITTGLSIGSIIDPDNGTLQNTDADNDNTDGSDDEDGVTFTSNLTTNDTSYSVDIDVTNTTGSDAEVIGWIDLNQDGDFDDTGEASNVATVSSSGTQTLTWDTSSSTIAAGTTYARFRLSTDTATLTTSYSTGALDDGEVEDYKLTVSLD